MLRKNLKGLGIGLSVFVLVVLSVIIVKGEVKIFHVREATIRQNIKTVKFPERLFGFLDGISDVRGTSPISSKWINERILSGVDFENHSVWYFPNTKSYSAVMDNWQRMDLGKMNARYATTNEAIDYYRDYLNDAAEFYFPFPWANYLIKFLVVVAMSMVPLILSLFVSLFTIKFSLSVATACLLLFAVMLRAQENMIEFGASTTGGKHGLSLFALHMDKSATGGVILFDQGIWGWIGPLFNLKNGLILAPVGLACGESKNGIRPEYISFLDVVMLKFGKWTPMVMGFFNQAIVKDKSSFAWAKTVLYYDFPGFAAGVRADHNFWKENEKWKRSLSIGPILKFVKKLGDKSNFVFQVSGTITKPHTLRTQWELDF